MILAAAILPLLATIGFPAESVTPTRCGAGRLATSVSWEEREAALLGLPGVSRIHDLHIWPMSTTEPVLTAHLVIPGGAADDHFLATARVMLHDRFGIGHATLQVETGGECEGC